MFGIFGPFILIIALIMMAVATVIGALLLLFLIFSVQLSAAMMVWTGFQLCKPEKRLRGTLMFIAGAFGTILVMIELLLAVFFFHSLRDASPWILLAAPGFGFGWPALGVAFPFFLIDIIRFIFRKPKSKSLPLAEPDLLKSAAVVNSVH